MKTVSLAPIEHKDAYTRALEPIVASYFRDVLYGPLLEILTDAKVPGARRLNGSESGHLVRALRSGEVWYVDGVFSGTFSPYVARELRELGAEFELKGVGPGSSPLRGFRIAMDKLPPEVRTASVASLERARAVNRQVSEYLDAALANYALAPTGIDVRSVVDRLTADLQGQFTSSIRGIETVEVHAQVTPGMREIITRDLTTNLDLDVKRFLSEEIPVLRKMAEESAFAGYRADTLARGIAARWGVGKRKAAFLAEQETSLIVSKYRETQARAIGSRTYVWSTSHDERVRPDHKRLNGTIQSWDSKPVTNLKTGARNAPGEDFRCRCVAIVQIALPDEEAAEVVRERRNCVATRKVAA